MIAAKMQRIPIALGTVKPIDNWRKINYAATEQQSR